MHPMVASVLKALGPEQNVGMARALASELAAEIPENGGRVEAGETIDHFINRSLRLLRIMRAGLDEQDLDLGRLLSLCLLCDGAQGDLTTYDWVEEVAQPGALVPKLPTSDRYPGGGIG